MEACPDLPHLPENQAGTPPERTPRPQARSILFRLDGSALGFAQNFVRRRKVRDLLDVFVVVSELINEEWTDWTRRAILLYGSAVSASSPPDDSSNEREKDMQRAEGDGRIAPQEAWQVARFDLPIGSFDVMKLRLVDHWSFLATNPEGHQAIGSILTEVDKVLEARRKEDEVVITFDHHLKRVMDGKVPENPAEMKMALDRLRGESLKEMTDKKNVLLRRAEARREERYRKRTEKSRQDRTEAHRQAARRVSKANAEFHRNQETRQAKYEASIWRARANRAGKAKPAWNAVAGDRNRAPKAISSFSMVEDEDLVDAAPTETLHIFSVHANKICDDEAGIIWCLTNVDEKLSTVSDFRDQEVFLHVTSAEADSPGNVALEWTIPVPRIKEWQQHEAQRLRSAKMEHDEDSLHSVPLRLTGHGQGQESMLWTGQYRVRSAKEDWSRKLETVVRHRDSKDPKKVAVPCNYTITKHAPI